MLYLDGRLDALLPLDDITMLIEADAAPVKPDGTTKADPEKLLARQQSMVANALKAGPIVVIICGGSHDFTEAIRAAAEDCEFIRISGPAYERLTQGGN